MAVSRHCIVVLVAGSPTSGKYVFIYKQGLYISSGDRIQAVDTDDNGVYWFDAEDANLDGSSTYDIGIYDSDPGSGNHTTVYNAQKKDERENRYFGAKSTITTLIAHKDSTSNPHDVTITQAIAKDGNADAKLTTANLNKMVDGSDASALHSHSNSVANEVIGTGDGGTKIYPFTLAKKPEVPGTIVITDSVETFSDNGDGTLTGDAGGSGTINYSTGVGSVTFNANVGNGQDITASYNYSKYTPENHADTHGKNGDDKITVTDDMIPGYGNADALTSEKIHVADTGVYYAGENVEVILQELGAELFPSFALAPTGLTGSRYPSINGVRIDAYWNNVKAATYYQLSIKNKETSVTFYLVAGEFDPTANSDTHSVNKSIVIPASSTGWEIKVRAHKGFKYSAWSSVVVIPALSGGDDLLASATLHDIINRVKKLTDSEGNLSASVIENITSYQRTSKGRVYIFGPDTGEYSSDSSGAWEKVIDSIAFSKGANDHNLQLLCNLYSGTNGQDAFLKLKITYPDSSTEESSVIVVDKNEANKTKENLINLIFDISKAATGSCTVDLYFKGTAGHTAIIKDNLGILATT